MDKRIIFAVAGSGKTTHIINKLNLNSRTLILTYTENNWSNIRRRVIDKFGHIPENISIQKFFTFLHSECYKPFLNDVVGAKGINWEMPPPFTLRLKRTDQRFYLDRYGRLYGNRISKLLMMNKVVSHVIDRLEKYYDDLYIDEIQDFGGHDFDFIKNICDANMNICFVGDYYQHTFDTSRDGNTNAKLYNYYDTYVKHFTGKGLIEDRDTLSKSYRCCPEVCSFVTDKLGIDIGSHKDESGGVHEIQDEKTIAEIYYDDDVVKLFYQNHKKYDCYSNNWGNSKGLDNYADVLISLYPAAYRAFQSGDFKQIPPSSLNKLYVALTRANGSVYFVEEKKLKCFQIK